MAFGQPARQAPKVVVHDGAFHSEIWQTLDDPPPEAGIVRRQNTRRVEMDPSVPTLPSSIEHGSDEKRADAMAAVSRLDEELSEPRG